MLIDQIDFAGLYQQQLQLAERTEKPPEHWDRRAAEMSVTCAASKDPYLLQLLEKIDCTDAHSLLDMGCGPGTVSLHVADQIEQVYGLDYSPGMLSVAEQRAQAMGLKNITFIQKSWEDNWQDVPECDIAVASRSTLVADLKEAMRKLNNKARLRIYTTHTVASSFVEPAIQHAIGRPVIELPNYIYAVNVLYQLGIHPNVSFIRAPNCKKAPQTFEQFAESVSWSLGALNAQETKRLREYYAQQRQHHLPLHNPNRDWALISWDKVNLEESQHAVHS